MFLEILLIILNIVILGFLFAGARFVLTYLPTYFGKQGKYLATQGDIVEIVGRLEQVETQTQKELYLLQAQVEHNNQRDNGRFDKEYEVLSQLWETLLDLQRAALSVQPVSMETDENHNTMGVKPEGLEKFADAFSALSDLMHRQRPFFPQKIYDSLVGLMTVNETLEEELQKNAREYWEAGRRNAGEIVRRIDRLCEQIRARVN